MHTPPNLRPLLFFFPLGGQIFFTVFENSYRLLVWSTSYPAPRPCRYDKFNEFSVAALERRGAVYSSTVCTAETSILLSLAVGQCRLLSAMGG